VKSEPLVKRGFSRRSCKLLLCGQAWWRTSE